MPIRIDRRSLEVIDLPAGEVRAADVPLLALAVGRQDERALARADQYSYSAHRSLLSSRSLLGFRGDFFNCCKPRATFSASRMTRSRLPPRILWMSCVAVAAVEQLLGDVAGRC